MSIRFEKQMKFIYEIDKVKKIIRKTKIFDGSRHENDAEHSWHLAIMALVLNEHSNKVIDVFKVIKMVLIHDMVEIDAGDTIVYDIDKRQKEKEELKCADRIFGLLPDDLRDDFFALWQEFEERTTPEAKFAAAIDRAEPIIQDYYNEGYSWRKHDISKEQVIEVNGYKIEDGLKTLWDHIKSLIDECEKKEYFNIK